ncbi:putative folate metabolism gamma-glutamate ligase [Wolbachia endosymbiont of Atemnus politus]|uniref:putative folate metabolism gamma-glutamate ligase n=1 Tax=Wolbachia endosymbiont of Atemnus politus TaxID=2682840 RepID=UPI0015729F13|nr:putative folate metabolism gamma-glutamate ligase [Wolbachia endosymbiont of Atemnus politus]NSM56643.1 putative folate metabolism gamma-glutamate ligase [Wolbachia endosymbiont of Atemnus politus]NSX83743.1 putative folate metabolism gamma-glutamate ligase [Wolbachia endosymbiont of Atemnus politus]
MHIEAIYTHRIECGEALEKILDHHVSKLLREEVVLAITSKIISVCQKQVVYKTACSKEELVRREADAIVDVGSCSVCLTMKDDILIPSAGIDESNGDGMYILYPKDVQKTAMSVWSYLRIKHCIKHLGVLITDSNITPMRRGVTGIALGWCGFKPLYSYVGKSDLYSKPLKVTQTNLLDALATSAVLVMGEGAEQTPMAIIRDILKISFLTRPPTMEEEKSVKISMEEDLYSPLLMGTRWLKNGE